jgi:nucleotide-binding universal stress UspA family protein
MIEIKKILFPTDFSEYSQHALRYAAALAESFKAKLYVMHACEHPFVGAGMEAYHFSVPEFSAEVQEQEKKTLEQITEELRAQKIDAESLFVIGKAYLEIVKCAKELEVDVITLATHGHKGISHFVFGSTAEKVVRLAPCPVLTVKHPEHDFVT